MITMGQVKRLMDGFVWHEQVGLRIIIILDANNITKSKTSLPCASCGRDLSKQGNY